MKKEEIEKKVTELIAGYIDSKGFELVDIEYVKENVEYFLRIFIEKEGGITLDDCVDVTRYINPILDEKDFIQNEYRLQVSSPGLDRALKKESDFKRYTGRLVEVKLFSKLNGEKEFSGTLLGLFDDEVKIEDKEIYTFRLKEIALIKLKVIM